MLEVRYHNTGADLRAALRAITWRLRLRWMAPFWIMSVGSAVPAMLLCAALQSWDGLAGGAAAWAAIVLLLRFKLASTQRVAFRAAAQRLRPATLRIAPAGLEMWTERGHIRSDWHAIDEVIAARNHLVMVTTALTLHIVPRNAFSSPADADAFSRTAAEYHRQARQSQRPQLAPSATRPADAAALEVDYQNTPDEFVRVQIEGIQQAGQPARKSLSWRGGLAFVGLGLLPAMILLRTHRETDLATAVGVFMFLMVTLVTMLMLQPLLRRWSRAIYLGRCDSQRIVTVAPKGVFSTDAAGEGHADWSEFSSVEESDDFIVFFQNNRTYVAALIPKQAFPGRAEADRFIALARHYWEQAQPQSEPAQRAETGNPYQSPVAR